MTTRASTSPTLGMDAQAPFSRHFLAGIGHAFRHDVLLAFAAIGRSAFHVQGDGNQSRNKSRPTAACSSAAVGES